MQNYLLCNLFFEYYLNRKTLSLKELTSPLGMFGELTYGFLLKFCFILLMDTIWMESLISALSELPGPSQPHTQHNIWPVNCILKKHKSESN